MLILQAMAIMVAYPVWALVPAGLFYVLFLESDQPFLLGVAAVWTLYLVYEYGVRFRILCSGDCAIRVDLIFAYPLLLLLTLAGLVVFFVHKWRE